jgi:hypothetical protein
MGNAIQYNTIGSRKICSDTSPSWWTSPEECTIYCVNGRKKIHGGKKDVDVGAIGKLERILGKLP